MAVWGLVACDGTPRQPPLPAAYFSANWAQEFTEVRNCRRSIDHDLHYIRVLCETLAHDPYVNRNAPFPEGSMVLKVEYNDENCTQVAGFSVMKKAAAGGATSSGDWHFQRTDAQRNTLQVDQPRCISCHAGCQAAQNKGYDWTCTDP